MSTEPSPVGNNPPDLSLGLTPQFWFHKWLPDPPDILRESLILMQIYALASVLSDEKVRTALVGQAREQLLNHLTANPGV